MATATDLTTLRQIYGKNPYDKQAQVLGQMIPNSGFASPLLAYAMGEKTASAEGWDEERNNQLPVAMAATTRQAGEAAAMDYATKMFKSIITVSEKDPVAATQMLKVESENGNNPIMKRFQGITFNAPTKDGWATVASSDGFVYHTYLPDLGKAMEAGVDSDLYKKTVVKIGEGKPPGQEKSPTDNDIILNALRAKNPQQANETDEAYSTRINGAALDALEKHKVTIARESRPPKEPADETTTDIKNLNFINGQRKAAGKSPMTLEEYKADPMKELLKKVVEKELGVKPAEEAKPAAALTPAEAANIMIKRGYRLVNGQWVK